MSSPTIRSVAKRAGVSTATVSRTLANPDAVRPETREKVIEAVQALKFVPNAQAVHFRKQATRTVILLVRDISNPFYLDIYKGVEEAAFAAGYQVLMGDGRNDAARMAHYVDMVRKRQADGLILMTGWLPPEMAANTATLPPMVVALEFIPGVTLPMVRIDNEAAARLAVEHLIGLGHRRIAHITGPTPEVMSLKRHAGYEAALRGAGIPLDPALVVRGDFHLDSGAAGVRDLLARGVDFTALFASGDEMAVGAITALRAAGLRVPEDVSVVGFDDIVFARAVDPPLTTIRQAQREIGAEAMRLMIGILEDETVEPAEVCVPVELVVRGTTARLSKPSQ